MAHLSCLVNQLQDPGTITFDCTHMLSHVPSHVLPHHSIHSFHGNRIATCQPVHPTLCDHLQLRRYGTTGHQTDSHSIDLHFKVDRVLQVVYAQDKLSCPEREGRIKVQTICLDSKATISVQNSLQEPPSPGDEIDSTESSSSLRPNLSSSQKCQGKSLTWVSSDEAMVLQRFAQFVVWPVNGNRN